LLQALVHRSYLNENPSYQGGSNERLEFLGDAVIGLIVGDFLFEKYPTATEGDLTGMRATLVRLQTLARAARSVGLHEVLFFGRGEAEAAGQYQRRPLGQAFEAVIGAVYLDQGLPATRDLVLRLLEPELARLTGGQVIRDAKSQLQVTAQADTGMTPVYRVRSATGPGHQPHYVVEVVLGDDVLATGEADKKQEAEQSAARQALENWRPPERA
jgi:ribonuclease-3